MFKSCKEKKEEPKPEEEEKKEEEVKEEKKPKKEKKKKKHKQTCLMDSVIFKEDGSYIFPKEWTRKQKKRISNKIRKRKKQGHVFPVTDLEAKKKKEEEEKAALKKPKEEEVKPKEEEVKEKKKKHKEPLPLGKDGKPLLGENLKLKIVDLGNGCWTHHHFSTEI